MTNHVTFQGRSVWRIAILFAFALASVSAWGARPAAAAQTAKTTSVTAATAADSHGCPNQDFCAFSGPNFTGSMTAASACGVARSIPYIGVGSWDNNQDPTLGATRASLRNSSNFTILTTAPARHTLAHFDWTDIISVVPC